MKGKVAGLRSQLGAYALDAVYSGNAGLPQIKTRKTMQGVAMMKPQAEWGPLWAVQRVVFQQYFKFDGRARRAEYWWFLGSYLIVALTMGVVVGLLGRAFQFRPEPVALVLSCALAAGCFPALLALWVRRCRDLGRSTMEGALTFLGLFLMSILSPIASGGIVLELPALLGQVCDGLFLAGSCYSLYVGLWPGQKT